MALANCVTLRNIDTDDIDSDKDFQGFVVDCLNAFFYNHQGFRYNSSQCNNLCHAFIAKLCKYFVNNWHILSPTKEVLFTKNTKCINVSKLGHRGKKVMQRAWKEMYRVVKEAQIYLQDCSSEKHWWMKSITRSIGGEAYAIHIHDLLWSVICLDLNYLYLQAETEESYTEASFRKISDFHAEMSNLTRIHDEYHDRRGLIFIFQELLKACEISVDDYCLTINVVERNKLGIAKFLSAKLQATIRGESSVIGSRICSWLQIDSKDLIPKQRLIGEGNFGKVYEGSWLGVKVAVKEIPLFEGDMDYLAPEIAAHAKLQSPFVVQLIGICITEKHCYFVMELVSSSLDKILEDRVEEHMPPLALPVAVDMMLQISRGMEYLHSQRIMHMDLKSSNVLIQPSAQPEFRDHGYGQVKICDFGEASLRLCSFRCPEDTKGTCMWRAPEVFSFAQQGVQIEMTAPKEYTSKADVYSFAMTCYEILTGKHPFDDILSDKEIYSMVVQGKRPSLPPSCPSVLADFIQKCWDTDPNRRPCFVEISNFMRYMKLLIMRIKDYRDWVCLSGICRDFNKAQLVMCECNGEERSDDRGPNSVEEGLIIRALEGDFPAFFQHRCFLQQNAQPLAPKIKVLVSLPDYIQQYSYKEVQSATDNFSVEVRGVSRLMWNGTLSDGTQVAVKKQQLKMSMTEISMLCQMHHPNAVRLRGISAGYEACLVFDHMLMGSLDAKLFAQRSILGWTIRRKIGLGIARFVAYLHNDHMKRFLNVEINATNVYLDERFTPKFGGFGSILPIEVSSQSLSSVDQQKLELALQFEEFRNVQDFGVILFELLTGCRWENMQYSLESIHDSIQGEEGIEFIRKRLLDRVLEGEVEMEEAMRWVRIALWCFVWSPLQKPNMNKVVLAMKGLFDVSPLPDNEIFKRLRRGQRVYITTEEQYSNTVLTEMEMSWVDVKVASSDKLMTRLPFSSERKASSLFSTYLFGDF